MCPCCDGLWYILFLFNTWVSYKVTKQFNRQYHCNQMKIRNIILPIVKQAWCSSIASLDYIERDPCSRMEYLCLVIVMLCCEVLEIGIYIRSRAATKYTASQWLIASELDSLDVRDSKVHSHVCLDYVLQAQCIDIFYSSSSWGLFAVHQWLWRLPFLAHLAPRKI